jgi:antitoxin component YwqK of YwqJK toxin-antitoxin module
MKKIILVFSVIFLLFGLSACSSDKPGNDNSKQKQNRPASGPSQFLDEFVQADWLNTLTDYSWDDIKEENGAYSYKYKEEITNGVKVNRDLKYEVDESGNYVGTMKIAFSETANSYIADIPKSFASHIDTLNFSIEPSKIINPDPIVEFENINGEIVIESLETKSEAEITESMEIQIIDAEAERCSNLPGNESLGCMLSLIYKYRGNDYIEEEISPFKLNEILGASAQAVFQSDLSVCRYVDDSDEKSLCYEYAYQYLIKDCNVLEDKKNRECVRSLSKRLPSLKEKRLLCAYIENETMRAECEGTASLEVCSEIEDKEERDMCRLNINRTKNDLESCQKLEDKNMQEACVAVIGADRADQGICINVKDEYIKGQCLAKIAMVKNDKTICSKIADNDSQDICNGYFIMKGNVNEEMCQNIHELFLKEMCQMVLAINNKDTFKCASPDIVSYDNQPICYLGAAIKHNDASLCSQIDINRGEFEEDRKIKEEMRDACYIQIAINTNNCPLCDNLIDKSKESDCQNQCSQTATVEEPSDEDKLAGYPPMPDWFDCPINEGTKLYTWKNSQQSGYRWTDPNYANRYRGPYLVWWGEGFAYPYQFICYNAEGEKHGPYKKWAQGVEVLREEGAYKNDELDGVIKKYSSGLLSTLTTYRDGKKNGYAEQYCTQDDKRWCNKGDLRSIGSYQNNQKHGFWKSYEFGNFVYKQEFINGEVTRDETGMSITYYSE